jgi:hypothetical protein
VFILVAEPAPEKRRKRREENERRVEKDMARLGDQTIFERDEERC